MKRDGEVYNVRMAGGGKVFFKWDFEKGEYLKAGESQRRGGINYTAKRWQEKPVRAWTFADEIRRRAGLGRDLDG